VVKKGTENTSVHDLVDWDALTWTWTFTLTHTHRAPMNSEITLSEAVPKPYSSFSAGKKRYIVFTAAGAGLFSSLSAQIYFPSLNTLAEDLNVSASLINLTVTSYMASAAAVMYPTR
jgi:hypothetical protein